jgi:hypothetical protein
VSHRPPLLPGLPLKEETVDPLPGVPACSSRRGGDQSLAHLHNRRDQGTARRLKPKGGWLLLTQVVRK